MKLKKRMLAVLLTLAVMVTFMPAVTLTANAASKTSDKVYTVKSEKNAIGDSTKYTYNKKGFVTKAVSKYTRKYSDSDSIETITTTYKYNKKNRITTKTTKNVKKETTYKTNKTTGKSTGKSLGTVTTTTTDVTKYTYKKGRATKAVTTSTTIKSGSITETDVSLDLENVKQLSNGNYIAGYNDRNTDGSYVDENTSANAYYYTGNIGAAAYTTTVTTSYKNNGNGTYTETVSTVSNGANFKETPKESSYKTADGETFTRIDSVNVELVSGGTPSSYNATTSKIITDKDVTTTTYKYDTRKRVKQANISTVSTNNESVTESTNHTYSYSDTTYIWDEATEEDKALDYTATYKNASSNSYSNSSTKKSSQVEKYSYNKKNLKTKTIVTDKGVQNSKEVYVSGRENSSEESSRVYADGSKSSSKETMTYSGTNDTTTTVYANGTRTETTTKNPYTCVSVENNTERDGSTSTSNVTTNYTFYKNGGSMVVTSNKENGKYADGETYVSDRESTRYAYDESGSKYAETTTTTRTTTPASDEAYTYSYINSVYNDGNGEKEYYDKWDDEVYTDDAAIKAAAEKANAGLTATGTPYVKAQSKAAKAKPKKTTTKYTYDTQGNLKTAKTTENWTEVESLRNETYGNTIYEYNSEGKTEEVETTVAHTYKSNKTKENKVKTGTNRVKSATTVSTSSSDRSTPSYAVGGRVTYTLSSKTIAKKAVRSDVELQQWMIQNPDCGSVAGLY